MKIERFEDIKAWNEARKLALLVYRIVKNNKDFGYRDQIRRAAVSVMNNIAEGFERKGDREFERFLFIAKGSCGEVRSMLYLSLDLGYISGVDFEKAMSLSVSISRMLSGFIKALNRS